MRLLLAALILSSVFTDHCEEESKRHGLALEKLQRARDEWKRGRMKHLDFMNKRLLEKNETRTYIDNVDQAMLEYYGVFAKQIKSLPPEPDLSDLYHPSGAQKMVNYYLLQWVQALQHMPYTSTLNK